VKTIEMAWWRCKRTSQSLPKWTSFYAEVSQKLGKIDVLFVNAGVAKFAPLAETSESLYDEQFDINIKARTSQSREHCPC